MRKIATVLILASSLVMASNLSACGDSDVAEDTAE